MGSSVILPGPGQPTTGPDKNFEQAAVPQLVSFKFHSVEPPSVLYIQRDDTLVINVASVGACTVTLSARLLLSTQGVPGQPDAPAPSAPPLGVLSPVVTVQQQFVISGATNGVNFTLPLQEGYLLSLVVTAGSGTSVRGQTFARVFIVRGTFANGVVAALLCADYVYLNSMACWPNGRVISATETPGWSHSVAPSAPGAGADWTLTVPAGTRYLVKSFSATFTASAAAASRNVTIIIDDGANIVWQDDVSASITAAQVASVNGTTTNAPAGVVTTTLFVVLPPQLFLPSAWRVRSSTASIQAGDQWSNIFFAVEQWFDGF